MKKPIQRTSEIPGPLNRQLRKIYLFKFFAHFHMVAGVLVPFFLIWGGISFTQVMILQSWFMFSIFLFEIPTGTIADFMGRKSSLLLGVVANMAGALIYGTIPNFFAFMAAESLWALAVALFSGADEAFVYDTLKRYGEARQSKKVLGRLESFHLGGLMVSAPVGSYLAAQLGLNAPMFLMVVPLFVALLIGLFLDETRVNQRAKKEDYFRIMREGVGLFRKIRELRILAFDFISIATVGYFMIWLYQPMLTQAGVPIVLFGAIHSVFLLSEILIMNNSERLEGILGRKQRLIFFSSLMTGLMFILGGLTSFIPVILIVIFLGGGFGLGRGPLLRNYMQKYIPSGQRATTLSAVSMLHRLSLMIVNPLVGFLAEWSLNSTLIILGAAALVFAFVSRVEEGHLLD